MSLVALLGRFTLVYLLLLVAIAGGLHLIDIQSNSGTNAAALMGAVMWGCLAFAKRNGRYLTGPEKRSIFVGMLTVDLLLQSGVLLLVRTGTAQGLPLAVLFYALAFVAGLHALGIWVMIGVAGKQSAKDAARAQRNMGTGRAESHLEGKPPVQPHGSRGGSGFHPAQPNLSTETER